MFLANGLVLLAHYLATASASWLVHVLPAVSPWLPHVPPAVSPWGKVQLLAGAAVADGLNCLLLDVLIEAGATCSGWVLLQLLCILLLQDWCMNPCTPSSKLTCAHGHQYPLAASSSA
jgi:hypothetical protein